MGIGNLYDDGNVLGETREVQLAADLIHPRGGKGGGGHAVDEDKGRVIHS